VDIVDTTSELSSEDADSVKVMEMAPLPAIPSNGAVQSLSGGDTSETDSQSILSNTTKNPALYGIFYI